MPRLFVSQELLDQWSVEGKIELSGNLLKIQSEDRTFALTPGVRFLRLAAGGDGQRLVGKVKSEDQLTAMGGELYMSSVLLGEDAYDVQGGFLADVSAGLERPATPDSPKATAAPTGAPQASVPLTAAAKAAGDAKDERSLLAQFLLENLP
jgi:hypothetical protein